MPIRVLCYQGVVQETKQWGEIDTYGGKLTENIVQAISRDLLGNSMLNLEANAIILCAIYTMRFCVKSQKRMLKHTMKKWQALWALLLNGHQTFH